jgi:hypothetical protein
MRSAAAVLLLAACGFHAGAAQPDDTAGPDAPTPDAARGAPDASTVDLPLYAMADTVLYAIDVAAPHAAQVADLGETIDGLAWLGDGLIGIGRSSGRLLSIDPATGTVSGAVSLAPASAWAGLTVIPAGELAPGSPRMILASIQGDPALSQIDPATGAVTPLGAFGSGLRFATDLAWVHGHGLYATVDHGSCFASCIVRINTATWAATIKIGDVQDTVTGLSGYHGSLWALNNQGTVSTIDPDHDTEHVVLTSSIEWSEAAE